MKCGYNWLNGFCGDVLNCHSIMRVLGQRSKYDLDLFYSQSFKNPLRQLTLILRLNSPKSSIKTKALAFSHV